MPKSIAALFTDEGYPAGPSDIVARLERFATPEARVVVAEHDGALLGFIAFCALPRFEHDDWIVRIVALVVDAGARERGVGRTLMAEAERIGHGARGGIHRDHRGSSPSGRPPSLRVDRLRRVRDRLPAQEAVAEGRRAPERPSAPVRDRTRPSLSPSGHAGGGDSHRHRSGHPGARAGQELRRRAGGRRHRLRRRAGRGVRPARPERGRQDDDGRDPGGPARPGRRPGARPGRRCRDGSRFAQAADRDQPADRRRCTRS